MAAKSKLIYESQQRCYGCETAQSIFRKKPLRPYSKHIWNGMMTTVAFMLFAGIMFFLNDEYRNVLLVFCMTTLAATFIWFHVAHAGTTRVYRDELSRGGEQYSEKSKKHARHNKMYLTLCDILWFVGTLTFSIGSKSPSDDLESLLVLFGTACLVAFAILSYSVERVVIFHETYYISGTFRVRYADITDISDVFNMGNGVSNESAIKFTLHKDGVPVGHDTMYEADFNHLRQILNTAPVAQSTLAAMDTE